MLPNILLISFDSVRADTFYSGKYPAINRLIQGGTSFRNAISSSPLTPVSHATVLTGLQPYQHGIRHLFREKLKPGVITWAEVMRKAGFATAAFVACAGLNHWYSLDRGFDVYDDAIPRLPDGRDPLVVVDVATRGSAYRRCPEITDRAIDWMTKAPQPFFAFVHWFDAHWPYSPPPPFDCFGDHPYQGEVAFMDSQLERLLHWLDDSRLAEDTLLIVFSDHGEDLGEHGGVGSLHPEESGHGCLLYDVTQRVPLVFNWGKLVSPNKSIAQQVRLVDTYPTVLDLLGLTSPARLDGCSLKPFLQGVAQREHIARIAYLETFFREECKAEGLAGTLHPLYGVRIDAGDRLIKVIWSECDGCIEVYDLSIDPAEQKNLFHGPAAP